MPRTMYDSTTATDIPTTAAVVLGYIDGPYAWSDADWARFTRAVKVRCAVRASFDAGHVLDVENGDATPAQAPGWVTKRRADGLATPTVYCSLSAWPSVRAAFTAAKVAEPLYLIAHYGAGDTIPAGAIGIQYADPPASGGHWDLSAVADFWPGVDEEEDVTAAEVWAEPIDNPLYDPSVTDTSDIRSHKTYPASDYLRGDWRADIQTQQTISAQSAAITALSSAVATQHGLTAQDVQDAVATAIKANVVKVVMQGASTPS